jgi:hypothetical protein
MALPREALAVLTTPSKTTPSGGIYFWCRYLIDGEPLGSVWMPDEENQWAEWLDQGVKVLVERLRPNPEYPSRVSGTNCSIKQQMFFLWLTGGRTRYRQTLFNA